MAHTHKGKGRHLTRNLAVGAGVTTASGLGLWAAAFSQTQMGGTDTGLIAGESLAGTILLGTGSLLALGAVINAIVQYNR